jgi:kumamolisin
MLRTRLSVFAVLMSFAIGLSGLAVAQDEMTPEQPAAPRKPAPVPAGIFRPQGKVITPASSVSTAAKGGHTNYKIFVPEGHQISSPVPDYTFAETPASMGCVYKVGSSGPNNTGCNPNKGGNNHATGGWGAIALVDAYDDPNAASDLAAFDSYWGLPAANFTVVYANSSFGNLNGLTADCSGTPAPANDYGWDLEESLDIEWSHAMAPAAHIILVEACDQSLPQLLFAEEVAGIEVSRYGGGDISNSWGYPESCVGNSGCGGGTLTEVQDDNYLFRYYWQDITYFASAGDSGAEVLYPSASPWVVSAGGTTINRDSSGNFLSESCWSDSGGGPSAVEAWQNPQSIANGLGPWTPYQYELFGEGVRVTPDISLNADPASGVYVYDTDEGGSWYIVGGTSVSSPALAGIVNASNNRFGQAPPGGGYYEAHENDYIYDQLYAKTAYPTNWYDVTTGSNGHAAGTGYDECTGIGSPRGKLGK